MPQRTEFLDTAWVRTCAQEAGFELCGFAAAEPLEGGFLQSWLEEGLGEGMPWMEKTAHLRLDVRKVLPGAQTVLMLGCGYFHPHPPSPVARFARSYDYHTTFRGWLGRLMARLQEAYPGMAMRAFVDSGPLPEKVWAAKAGLGFIGKNSCLIHPRQGSWLLLASLLLTLPADSLGEAVEEACGSCRACIEACPTGALLEGKRVDARRCLSFHTIENKGEWPEAVRTQAGGVFGCDICQEACPHNRKAKAGHEVFMPRAFALWPLERFRELNEEDYAQLQGTPLVRAKRWGLCRNASYALEAAPKKAGPA